eukprot:tig00000339_g24181.t1
MQDRFVLTCQWLDEHQELSPVERIPDSKLNFRRDEYAHDKFLAELLKGKLAEYLKNNSSLEDLREAVRRFLTDYGGIRRLERKARPPRACDLSDSEGEGEGKGAGADADGQPQEEDGDAGDEKHTRTAAPSAARVRKASVASTRVGKSGFSNVILSKDGFWRGKIKWRHEFFSTASSLDAEDAAQYRDRAILCCQWADEHEGIPEEDRISDDQLNFDRSTYEEEQFYVDLLDNQLEDYIKSAPDPRKAIRKFLADRGAYQTLFKKHVDVDAMNSKNEDGEADSELEEGAGADREGEGEEEEDEDAPAPGAGDGTASSSRSADRVYQGVRRTKPGFPGYFMWRGKHFATPAVSASAEEAARLRDCYMVRIADVEDVVRLDGRYHATFFLEKEKAFSPPLASADGAIRFIDRCQIGWCGPEGERLYRMQLYHPIHEYTSEAWYRKLFTGPEGQRPPFGNNDPAWRANPAAAVRRTVAFIESEVATGPAAGGGCDHGGPAEQPAKKQKTAAVAATCTASAAAQVPVAAAVGPPAFNPAAVLEWEAPETLEWLVRRLGLASQPRARRVLERLALTGRMLLMCSAAGLWQRLLRKLEEEVAAGGADTRLGDALEAAFAVLDAEVRILVDEAKRACGEGAPREEIAQLFALRSAPSV